MQTKFTVSLLQAIAARGSFGTLPSQYLENIGPAKEQSDWLILVVGPLAV